MVRRTLNVLGGGAMSYRVFHVALTDFEARFCIEKHIFGKIDYEILFLGKGHLSKYRPNLPTSNNFEDIILFL